MSTEEIAAVMACRLAREVHDGDVVGVGLGTPLALAAALVARRAHAPGADVIVAGAVSPDADLTTCLRGAAALDGLSAGYAVHMVTMEMAERRGMTMQFLRPAQVDGDANANTSRIRRDGRTTLRLPGGLATADVLRILPRVVLYHTDHRLRSLPQRVSFVSGAGGGDSVTGTRGPVCLVTDRAVFTFGPGGPRLESVHPGEDVEGVLAETGFAPAANDVGETVTPSATERAALDAVDPDALRELELRDTHAAAAERFALAHAHA